MSRAAVIDPTASSASWHEGVRARALAKAAAAPAVRPRALVAAALLIALALHLLLAYWLYLLMQTPAQDDRDRIEVRLIDAPPVAPALPEPPAMPMRVPAPQLAPPRIAAARAPAAPPTPAIAPGAALPSVRVYNPDGSLNLPKDLVEQIDAMQPKPNFIAKSTAPSPIMLPHRPLKIRPNHFADAWVHPQNETLLSDALRRATDFVDQNLTAEKDFTLPSGDKVKCKAVFMFVMAGAGCGWGFPPEWGHPTEPWKPATVLDER